MKIEIGKLAPDFVLPDKDGKEHKLSEYKGSWVLIYFYPRDNTPGCTKEACQIRDNFSDFKKLDTVVLGISADSVASHQKFSEKFNLPFPILSDTEKVVAKLFGVWGKKKFMGREYMGIKRMSFLINPQGKIAKIYEQVKPDIHAKEVLEDLKNFSEKN